ncbi:MAG: carbohydrate kinase family protein [Bacilli bacterium]
MNQVKKVLCIGGANVDIQFHLRSELMLGTSNPVFTKHSFGGVVRNVGENLGRLGVAVTLFSIVGDDESGKALLKHSNPFMNVLGVDCLKQKSSGCYYAIVNNAGNMEVAFADMDLYDGLDEVWIDNKLPLMFPFDYILADMNIKQAGLSKLISWCLANHKFLAIVGVSGPKMHNLPNDLNNVDLIVVNRDETQTYFKTNEQDIKKLCLLWKQKKVGSAIVTAGKDGIAGFDKNSEVQIFPIQKVDKIVNVTGAGDAFCGGVLFGLINNYSFPYAIKLGTINASKTIQTEATVRDDLSKEKLLQEEKHAERI